MKSVLYIFKGGRKRILKNLVNAEAPTEFLYGIPYFKEKGYLVDVIEQSDLSAKDSSLQFRIMSLQRRVIVKMLGIGFDTPYFLKTINKINNYDVTLAIPDSIAIALTYYRKKGWLKRPVIFFAMGLAARLHKLKQERRILYQLIKLYFRKLLKNCDRMVVLGIGEYNFLVEEFWSIKDIFHFLPFGIDVNFWRISKNNCKEPTILFIGNDVNRDYDLAVKIAERMNRIRFIFVTSKIDQKDVPDNVQLLRGDWRSAPLSDIEIRDIYLKSTMVLIPLKNSLQPSGQSVALQAMACGRPVIISKTEGFWDPESYIDGEHCIFAKSNNVTEWTNHIDNLLGNEEIYSVLVSEGRKLVEDKYSTQLFSQRLEEIISPLSVSST